MVRMIRVKLVAKVAGQTARGFVASKRQQRVTSYDPQRADKLECLVCRNGRVTSCTADAHKHWCGHDNLYRERVLAGMMRTGLFSFVDFSWEMLQTVSVIPVAGILCVLERVYCRRRIVFCYKGLFCVSGQRNIVYPMKAKAWTKILQ